jgi:SAM-dependent methyltransferase
MTGEPHGSEYLDLPLTADTQDLHIARNSILRALREQLPRFTGTFLDIGCGYQPYRPLVTQPPASVVRYIGMDLGPASGVQHGDVVPEVEWDGISMPLDSGSIDSAMATEVLEHCPDPLIVLREAHRVMRPGGVLFVTVPYLWPIHNPPHDEYRYTPFAMERLLAQAGFGTIVVRPMGGWDASLAQMLGLWAMRRPMSGPKRALIKRITLPLIRYLLKVDSVPDPSSSPMITGLWATAVRQ